MTLTPGVHQGDGVKLLQESGLRPALIVCDPPYNYSVEYEAYKDSVSDGAYLTWSCRWMEAVYDALTPNGTFWLIIADEWQPELTVMAKEIGFDWRSTVVWYYTFGVHCEKKFSRSHTMLVYFTKGKKPYFNREAILVPSARATVYGDSRAAPAGKTPDDTWIYRPQDVAAFVPGEDTWHIPRVNGSFKERVPGAKTQLPEALLERVILATSHVGDIVLDPMCGTGTTPVVAKRLGRVGYGFELGGETARKAQVRYDATDGPESGKSA